MHRFGPARRERPTRSLATAAYALRTVARNRRSTASALLGLVLGVAVVAAPWVAIDSSIRGLFNWYLEGVVVDAVAQGFGNDVANATVALAAVPNVARVEPTYEDFARLNTSPSFETVHVYLVRSTFGDVLGRLGLSWSAAPGPGTIVLPSGSAATVRVGDTVGIDREDPIWSNGTIVGSRTLSSRYSVGGFYNLTRTDGPFIIDAVFLSSSDVSRYRSDLNLTPEVPLGFLFAWLNRDALIDPLDPSGTSARLQREKILMENALAPYGYFIAYGRSPQGGLEFIPGVIESRSGFLRIAFTALTIPTLALALLLARVGFDVGLAPRRRELAILRSRGLSVRGVRLFLTVEAGLLAIVGGALGLAVGLLLSRLFLGAVLAGTTGPAPIGDFALTLSTVAFALSFGAVLAFGASWRAIRILSSEDIVAILKAHHGEEVSIPHRASRDFLMAGVAAAGILLLLASASLKGSPFSPLGFILGLSTAVLAPVAPFLLTIAVARYLTRGTTRPYRAIARLFRPLLGEVHPLVEKNLARSPRRSSNIALIVTFAVGFVVAVLMLAASSEAYRMEEVLRRTPSDVVAEWTSFAFPWSNLSDALTRIRGVSGVAAVTPVLVSYTNRAPVIAFEASSYLETVPWVTARHLGGADPRALMAALDQGGTFASNRYFADPLGLQPGDSVTFSTDLGADLTVRLVAVVSGVPGLYIDYSPYNYLGGAAYVDLGSLPPTANLSQSERGRFLIRVAPGADSIGIADAVQFALGGLASVRTIEQDRREALADPFANLFFGFLLSQGELAVAILVVAIGLFVFSASASRREELATLVARGFPARAVAGLLMAEGWVVTILGILLGLLAAAATVWTVLEIAVLVNPTPTSVPFVVPATIILPLALVVLGVFAAGWLGTIAIRRMDVVRVLKMRGG